MARPSDIILTASAPVIWGSTYIVTTQLLPPGFPLTAATLRALPAGLILLIAVRRLPPRDLLGRIFILGALNFTLFWAALFVSAYRLPGGVAATLGATQPLIVLLLSRPALGLRIEPAGVKTQEGTELSGADLAAFRAEKARIDRIIASGGQKRPALQQASADGLRAAQG